MAYELFGIIKGQPIQSLAICSTLEVAEYHKENTFTDFAGRVIIQETEKTQNETVQEIYDIASPIFKVDATMSATDWETLKCDITQTNAIELYEEGTLKDVNQLNVVEMQPIERKKLKATMLVLESEGQPFHKLFAQMQEEILAFLTKGTATTTTRKKATNEAVAPTTENPVTESVETVTEESPVTETVEAVTEESPVTESVETVTEESPVAESVETVTEESPVTETVETMTEESPVTETVETMTEGTPSDEELLELLEDLPVDVNEEPTVHTTVEVTPQPPLDTTIPVNEGIAPTVNTDIIEEDGEFDIDSFEAMLNDI